MSKVIVALDGFSEYNILLDFAHKVQGHVWGFKVNDALLQWGCRVITDLKAFGNVMADPKLYDIPNTVANGVKSLVLAGADMITVHAQAGSEVLRAAKDAAENRKILAITVLTSDNQEDRKFEVRKRAYLAYNSGCDGIVCAAPDLEDIKDITFLKVVPGIRPSGKVEGEDQVHVSSMIPPLASFVVIGRPVVQAKNPIEVLMGLNGK